MLGFIKALTEIAKKFRQSIYKSKMMLYNEWVEM